MSAQARVVLDVLASKSPRQFALLCAALANPPGHGEITLRFTDGKFFMIERRDQMR